jgi:hypothetical protein
MQSVNAVNNGGCSVGDGTWRIEHCVLGDTVADAVFKFYVSNVKSEFLSDADDLWVVCSSFLLTFTVEKTGEECKVSAYFRGYYIPGQERSTVVSCSLNLPEGSLKQIVSDALNHWNAYSVPLVRRHVWDSTRNPANAAEQSAV